jgi:hypothetical protein
MRRLLLAAIVSMTLAFPATASADPPTRAFCAFQAGGGVVGIAFQVTPDHYQSLRRLERQGALQNLTCSEAVHLDHGTGEAP